MDAANHTIYQDFLTDGAPVFYPILKLANQKPTDII